MAGKVTLGTASNRIARRASARQASQDRNGQASEWQGSAGMATKGAASCGKTRLARIGLAGGETHRSHWLDTQRPGKAGTDRSRPESPDPDRPGTAWQAWNGIAGLSTARQGRQETPRQGTVRHGSHWHRRHAKESLRMARPGAGRLRSAGQARQGPRDGVSIGTAGKAGIAGAR